MAYDPNRIWTNLKAKGLRLTPARQMIIEILQGAGDNLLGALEIYEQVKKRNGRINFSTVYRNLVILEQYDFVEKLQLGPAASFRLANPEAHIHLMICTSCHRTEPLPFCPVQTMEETLRDSSGFLPTRHRIEILGYCKECQKNKI